MLIPLNRILAISNKSVPGLTFTFALVARPILRQGRRCLLSSTEPASDTEGLLLNIGFMVSSHCSLLIAAKFGGETSVELSARQTGRVLVSRDFQTHAVTELPSQLAGLFSYYARNMDFT